jgi:beta-lactamase regulating signal transducer with metallopeptidase domain
MHEHLARAMYYVNIHLLYASIVGCAAWALTSIHGATPTAKYWVWIVTVLNFIVPAGAMMDSLWAPRLGWAAPLGVAGDLAWRITEGPIAIAAAAVWLIGAVAMVARLAFRLRLEHRESSGVAGREKAQLTPGFVARGILVKFDPQARTPAVNGVIRPRISLPHDIADVLDAQELDAVLLHELRHATRRDNLIRLVHELALCVLWFHPLVWLAGRRLALFRELSCDEWVIEGAHGGALVSALAKLAAPDNTSFLHATVSSHLRDRLALLEAPPRPSDYAAGVLLTVLFASMVAAGVFGTVAHTACCFVLKH